MVDTHRPLYQPTTTLGESLTKNQGPVVLIPKINNLLIPKISNLKVK